MVSDALKLITNGGVMVAMCVIESRQPKSETTTSLTLYCQIAEY